MTNIISHQGIVENIHENHIRVRIIQTSACAACSVKGYCSSADSKEKIIEIYSSGESFRIGEPVEIIGETSMGMMAVFIAFVIPFFILIITLFIVMSVSNGDELLSGGISLTLLIPYYIVLGLNKNKLKKSFSFKIKPK